MCSVGEVSTHILCRHKTATVIVIKTLSQSIKMVWLKLYLNKSYLEVFYLMFCYLFILDLSALVKPVFLELLGLE